MILQNARYASQREQIWYQRIIIQYSDLNYFWFASKAILMCDFFILQAQDDYISDLLSKFNDLQRYAVSTEEVSVVVFVVDPQCKGHSCVLENAFKVSHSTFLSEHDCVIHPSNSTQMSNVKLPYSFTESWILLLISPKKNLPGLCTRCHIDIYLIPFLRGKQYCQKYLSQFYSL